jgi:hypothetical protein
MIAAGYEDGNDASSLRGDPMFKMALDLSPSDRELCSQSTISRLENLPDARALLRMGLAAHGPRHGRSLLRVLATRFPNGSRSTSTTHSTRCTAASSCDCSTRIMTNMAFSRSSCSTAGAASSPPCFAPPNDQAARNSRQGIRGKEIKAFLRRLLRALRANWPKTEILLRGDSHYCCLEVLDWRRSDGLDFILGVAPTSTLRKHIVDLEANAGARFEAAPSAGKARRFREFLDGAASWSRAPRIIARVEAGMDGPDTRFVVANLEGRSPRALYEDGYCRRGQAENHIKSWKTHLAAEGASCTKATANQLRLFLHAGAN